MNYLNPKWKERENRAGMKKKKKQKLKETGKKYHALAKFKLPKE